MSANRTSSLSYRTILSVAAPIMVGMFVQFAVLITDSAFLNKVSTEDFNASGNAGMLYVTLFMLAMGISNGAQVMIARRNGENNFVEAGELFRQSLFVLAMFSILFFGLLMCARYFLLDSIVKDPLTCEKMKEFLDVRSFGFFFSMITLAYQGFYTGIAKTKIIMYYTLITATLNVVLDYGMIFGKWGFSPMGIHGAALATVISEAVALLFVIAYTKLDKDVLKYKLKSKFHADLQIIRPLMKLSFPLMMQGAISTGAWTLFFFFIEQMGKDELEISQTIRMFYLIALIPVLGIGSATRTFVSSQIAEGKTDEVVSTVFRIVVLNLLATLLFVLPNILATGYAVSFISDNPDVREESILVLRIVTGAMFLLAISMPLLNLISGAGDTRTTFKIEMISIVIYLICAWFVTVKYTLPIHFVWCLEYLYFGIMTFACIYYIRKGKWKNIKV